MDDTGILFFFACRLFDAYICSHTAREVIFGRDGSTRVHHQEHVRDFNFCGRSEYEYDVARTKKKGMNMRHQHARIVLLSHRVNLYPSLQVEYSSHHYSQAECKIETKLAEDHVMSSNNIARPDVQDKTISKAHHVPTGTCINRMRFGTAQDMRTCPQ